MTGVRVLEWSEGIAGPLAAQMLGDLGAEVIKVERPQGDWGRTIGPGSDEGSSHFMALNRNKRNICINVQKEEGLKVVKELIKQSDVLITNYRPGVIQKLGLSDELIKQLNPEIVYGRVAAFQQKGDMANAAGSDTILQALSGIMDLVGDPKREPFRVGFQVVDHTAARDLVIGILGALISKSQGTNHAPIEVSLLATSAALLGSQWQELLTYQKAPRRSGNSNAALSPSGVYVTKDEEYISIAVLREEHWYLFCKAIGIEEALSDHRFCNNENRIQHRSKLDAIIQPIMLERTRDEWIEYLSKSGVLIAPVSTIQDVYNDPKLRACIPLVHVPETFVTSKYQGKLRSIGLPFHTESYESDTKYGPPAKGEHSRVILKELGFDKQLVNSMIEAQVIIQHQHSLGGKNYV